MSTIATLAISLIAHHEGFTSGMEKAAKSHDLFATSIRSAHSVIEATKSSSEVYSDKVNQLQGHLQSGKISLDQYEKALEMVQEGYRKTQGEARGFHEVLEGLGVIAAAEAMMELGEKTIETAHELGEFVHKAMEGAEASSRMAATLGLSIEEMGRLEYSARLTHTPVEALSSGMQKMLANLGAIGSDEGKKASAVLGQLGLDAEELINASPAKAFEEIAEGISHVGNASERMRDARALFGKGGGELLPILREGAEGLEKMWKEGEHAGFVLNSIDSAKIESANLAVNRLGGFIEGVGKRLATEFAPYIEAAATKMFELGNHGETMGHKVFTAVEMGAKGLGYLADVAQIAIDAELKMIATFESSIAATARGVLGLVNLYNRIPGTIKVSTDRLAEFAASETDVANGFKFMSDKAGEQKWAHETVDEYFKSIGDGAQKAAELAAAAEKSNGKIRDFTETADENAKQLEKAAGQLDAFLAKLQSEVAASGKGGETAEFIRMQQQMQALGDTSAETAEKLKQAHEALDQLRSIHVADAFAGLDARLDTIRQSINGMGESARLLAEFKQKFQDATPQEISAFADKAEMADRLEQLKRFADEAHHLADAGRSATEKYNDQLDHLKQALEGGAISWDEYARAVEKAHEAIDKGAKNQEALVLGQGQNYDPRNHGTAIPGTTLSTALANRGAADANIVAGAGVGQSPTGPAAEKQETLALLRKMSQEVEAIRRRGMGLVN